MAKGKTDSKTAAPAGNGSALVALVAGNIKARRVRLGLSQGELAAKSGICVSYVSMIERTQRTPPLETLHTISKSLRCNVSDLFRKGA